MDPKIDQQTSVAFCLKLVFTVRWRTSSVAVLFLGFVSGIGGDFYMALVLSCVDLVATFGRSASDNIASIGVVLSGDCSSSIPLTHF